MFEVSIPQDYGIQETIALVTNEHAKRTELYHRIKLAFAQKFICFQDVTLDDYKSVTIMQEDNRYTFPFLIISDGLQREVLSAEEALRWIDEQEIATPKYNGYMLYYKHLHYEPFNSMDPYYDDTNNAVDSINLDFIESDDTTTGTKTDDSDDSDDLLPF